MAPASYCRSHVKDVFVGLRRRFRVGRVATEDVQRDGQLLHVFEDFGRFLFLFRTLEVEE